MRSIKNASLLDTRTTPFLCGWSVIRIEQEVIYTEHDLFFNNEFRFSRPGDDQSLFGAITNQFEGNKHWVMANLEDCAYDIIAFEILYPYALDV